MRGACQVTLEAYEAGSVARGRSGSCYEEWMNNVKIFGPVDERSLKQLERCMVAGDAEWGVLCADHHPGYSQPIGGAVAVNLMADAEGHVWIGVHFGSRGFGHKTASGFLALAQGLPFDAKAQEGEMDSPPVLFAAGSELGEAYVSAMQLAGDYAYAGRDVVVDKVLELLHAEAVQEVHNHHNFAWREEHFGRTYWVIRKGCTPASRAAGLRRGLDGGRVGDSRGDCRSRGGAVALLDCARRRSSDEPLSGRRPHSSP